MISFIKRYKEAVISVITLAAALLIENGYLLNAHPGAYLTLYGVSYLAVGGPVWIKAFQSFRKGVLFSEFFLMGIATAGALILGEYAEGVAVMLFYMIGEYAQHGAVDKARSSISKLIDQLPDVATVERAGRTEEVHPSEVKIGEIIRVLPGEKVPLDGELISDYAAFNTAALTGESRPMSRETGEEIWAGSINQDTPARIRVTRRYQDSRLSNILDLVQEASRRKAPTQRFMAKFARVYTPIVVWLAVALTFLPYFFVESYLFEEWFYRALIFLVISCPCGLVISIPLGYFGGIGAASQNGILLKGSDYLDQLRKMSTLFIDKTGTLTEGVFAVQNVEVYNGYSENELIHYASALERQSTHPIARAIVSYSANVNGWQPEEQQEIAGQGVKGRVNGKSVLVGNRELLEDHGVAVITEEDGSPRTYVHVAMDGEHAGTLSISDQIREDSRQAVRDLRNRGVSRVVMLSGDHPSVVTHVAKELGIDEAYGGLMPDDKYAHVDAVLGKGEVVGFAGDGVNDAPVIALADVGIAMGGVGSDASVETADVVIQTDQPSKIARGIDIARYTHRVVWQNIIFALVVKVLVMTLATMGMATMWEAIFADVGVALIAIANAIRVQQKFSEERMSIFSFFRPAEGGGPQHSHDHEQGREPAACCAH